MSQNDMRLHIFLFLLRISLFVATGIVLHNTENSLVINECPGLWESMLTILCIKCMRLTMCPLVLKVLKRNQKCLHYVNVMAYAIFFVVECVVTSQSLNSIDCVKAASLPSGHPMLAYVNSITCVYDGAYVLSHALFAILNRF
jgi:hypothetical protein